MDPANQTEITAQSEAIMKTCGSFFLLNLSRYNTHCFQSVLHMQFIRLS